ncbi:hypothetical protein B0H13DRAFT_1977597, partial [Mycena leptocephala]
MFYARRLIGRKFDDNEVQADMKHFPFTVFSNSGKPYIRVEYCGEQKELYISAACSQEVECGSARGRRSKRDNLTENRPIDEEEENKCILYRTHLARIRLSHDPVFRIDPSHHESLRLREEGEHEVEDPGSGRKEGKGRDDRRRGTAAQRSTRKTLARNGTSARWTGGESKEERGKVDEREH